MKESRTFLDQHDVLEVIKKCFEDGEISKADYKLLTQRMDSCPTLTIRGPGKAPEAPYISVADACGLLSDIEYYLRGYIGFDVSAVVDEFSKFISSCKAGILKAANNQRPEYKEFTAADTELLLLKIQDEIEQRTIHCLVGKDVRLQASNIIDYHRKQLRESTGKQQRVVVPSATKEKLDYALSLLQQVKEDIDK